MSSTTIRTFRNIFLLQNHRLFLNDPLAMDLPDSETNIIPSTTANSLRAAIFHTMAFKLSLEINNDQITFSTKRAFLKILYNVCQIRKKNINFEQYTRIQFDGKNLAIRKTASNAVFIFNSSFTTKVNYFRTAIEEACDAFNKIMVDFGDTQKLEIYDPTKHQTNPHSNILFTNLHITQLLFTDLHLNIVNSSSSTKNISERNSFTALPPHHRASFHQCVAAVSHRFTLFVSLLQLVFAALAPTAPCRINFADSTSTGLCRLYLYSYSSISTVN